MGSSFENVPALAPPVGLTSHLDQPEPNNEVPLVACFLSLALVLVFVALRLYSRISITRSIGCDDCR